MFFPLLRLPPRGALRYLYRKNITNFHLLKTKTAHRFMRYQNEYSKRAKWVFITCSKNKHFWKQSHFILFLQIVGSNNTAIDSSAAGFYSAEVFPTNSQASTSFKLSSLNIRPWNVESLESTNNSHLANLRNCCSHLLFDPLSRGRIFFSILVDISFCLVGYECSRTVLLTWLHFKRHTWQHGLMPKTMLKMFHDAQFND